MAATFLSKKAVTVPPTIRTLASGVPSASLINLNVRSPAGHGHHEHGAAGPRSDAPSKWVGGVSANLFSGVVSKTHFTGMSSSHLDSFYNTIRALKQNHFHFSYLSSHLRSISTTVHPLFPHRQSRASSSQLQLLRSQIPRHQPKRSLPHDRRPRCPHRFHRQVYSH